MLLNKPSQEGRELRDEGARVRQGRKQRAESRAKVNGLLYRAADSWRLTPFLLSAVCLLICLKLARAATINAASCNARDMQAALNKAQDGDTVLIPAGTCHWQSTVSVAVPGTLTIMGAGSQTIRGGGDQTIIIDDVPRCTGNGCSPYLDPATFVVTTKLGKAFRLTGITFQGGTNGTVGYSGVVYIGGNSQQVRIDHVHLNVLDGLNITFSGWEYGVVDHCLFDQIPGTVINGVHVTHDGWNGVMYGDGSWADFSYFGTEKAIYVEDNTFNNGFVDDTGAGGRIVFRHNTVNRSVFQGLDGIAPWRGTRMFEVYGNTFDWHSTNPNTDQWPFAMFLRTGTGLIWGNTVTNGYVTVFTMYTDRADPTRGDEGWGYCNGTNPWDQNSDSSGYACLDQLGRGKGDLLYSPNPANGDAGTIDTVTGTVSWPNQALEPIYEWNDIYNPPPQNGNVGIGGSQQPNVVKQNRDFYLGTDNSGHPITFNGASGVGSGLLSARPTTCTPNVAYWATDTNTLYQCASSPPNTWTVYYTPYTYPHPLQNAGGGGYSACDLNQDSSTNVIDVQLEVNMALGAVSCTADINKDGACNVVDVQRVVNAALGGQCVTGP